MTATSWRAGRVTPLGEISQPSRITGTAVRLTIQVFLTVCLWRALYAGIPSTGGLTRDQAITYAVLAVLATQIRGLDRSAARDTMLLHVQEGTILYWFLRPVAPRRYYLIRALGDQAYGLAWVTAGYLIGLAAGWIEPPASAAAAGAFAAGMVLAQTLIYQLLLAVDLFCFWTLQNHAALLIVRFLQNLLSGVIAPLWFFPEWFLTASWFLPFRYTLDIPLSLYIGRLPPGAAPRLITAQLAWCLALAALNHLLWRRAEQQVIVQGG